MLSYQIFFPPAAPGPLGKLAPPAAISAPPLAPAYMPPKPIASGKGAREDHSIAAAAEERSPVSPEWTPGLAATAASRIPKSGPADHSFIPGHSGQFVFAVGQPL